ncbi:MAG: hypothetical protein N2449_07700 [Bacteroidales bacterium]|nr:hypothetical protein [Bacteroidales bacterium]
MNKIKLTIFGAMFALTFFSCRTLGEDPCYVPILVDSLKCTSNIKDTTNTYKIDSIKFTIDFYYHLSENWQGDCEPLTHTTDFYSDIYILTNNKFLHYNSNDTINNICSQVIYYMPHKIFYKGNVLYLYDHTAFTFDKLYLCNINKVLMQNEGKPPIGIITFKISQPPDSLHTLHLKCIVKLKTGKTFIKDFKPIKVIP